MSSCTSLVKSYSHLGHIINARMDDADDIPYRQGRPTFIGQVNNAYNAYVISEPWILTPNADYSGHIALVFMAANYGVFLILACRISVRLGERVSVKYGNCHIEHIPVCCHYCAIVYLSLTKYVYGHLILSTDVFLVSSIWSGLILSIV